MKDSILKTVKSHLTRSREGYRLLEEGRPLSEMKSSIDGPDNDELEVDRLRKIAHYNSKSNAELTKILDNIEFQIKRAEQRKEVGTSGLHWQRVIICDLLGK